MSPIQPATVSAPASTGSATGGPVDVRRAWGTCPTAWGPWRQASPARFHIRRYLPHDFLPYTAVYYYFGKWRDDGTDQAIHDLLRRQVRESRGRHEDPSAIVMDAQTVHASVNAPRRRPGWIRARGGRAASATDVLGLLIAVIVVAASVHDNAIGITLLDKVAAATRR